MIYTKSAFFYNHVVTSTNNIFIINKGASDIEVAVETGTFSFTQFAIKVVNALNSTGDNAYTISINRTTRKITITSDANFDMLYSSRPTNSLFNLLGFTADQTGSDSYEGDSTSGDVYYPQFKLQSYKPFRDNKSFLQGKVNESASGIPEIVSFGELRVMDMNLTFITNEAQRFDSPIEENLSGVEDARSFMEFCINKSYLEFMEDRENPNTYYTVMLDKTSDSSDGIGYTLKNLASRKLPKYYETGKITFRNIDTI